MLLDGCRTHALSPCEFSRAGGAEEICGSRGICWENVRWDSWTSVVGLHELFDARPPNIMGLIL